MKHEYRKTKPPTIEENYDRPQKKRGGKKKPFRVIARSWKNCKIDWSSGMTLGHYETHERAAQAMKKFEREWGNCEIMLDI